ncbi:HNH endonuclease [Lysobacter brunescens]|uniref:HNH endonuclease n=1 Tax=Lysobacter brunescens TaxID=262323 RepID=A0ABW2Y8T3_9GAMM
MAASPEELQSFARAHGLKAREARALLATAEHLHARRDGGGDSPENIVAAHHVCNRRRHQAPRPKSPEEYRSRVQRRCRNGKWHSTRVLRLMPLHQCPS